MLIVVLFRRFSFIGPLVFCWEERDGSLGQFELTNSRKILLILPNGVNGYPLSLLFVDFPIRPNYSSCFDRRVLSVVSYLVRFLLVSSSPDPFPPGPTSSFKNFEGKK